MKLSPIYLKTPSQAWISTPLLPQHRLNLWLQHLALRGGKSHSEYLPPPFCFKHQTLGGWKARKNEKKLRAPYGPKQGCGTLGVSILVADIDWPVDAFCEAGIQRLALSLSTHAFSEGPAGASYCTASSLIQKECLLFISSITRLTSALPAESAFLLGSTCPLDRFSGYQQDQIQTTTASLIHFLKN